MVVGNGNVAVDCARMLALTREELAVTDTVDHAIEVIAASPVKEIVVLGRRGPAQAAFTNPELLELGEMAGADIAVDPADLELDPISEASLAEDGATIPRRNVEVLREYATSGTRGQAAGGDAAVLRLPGGAARRRAGRGAGGGDQPARAR